MRIYKCDKCEKEIKDIYLSDLRFEKTKYTIEGHFLWKRVKEEGEYLKYQLCPECSEELLKWLGKIKE